MSSNPVPIPNPTTAPAAAVAAAPKPGGGKKDPAKAAATVKKKVRRKKPPSAKGPTSQAIVTAGRNATGELNDFKAAEFAKRKDPLWYRTSEVLQAISGDSSPVPGLLAEQVDLVEAALQRNHLTRSDVTPQAFGVLLEQARRYALEIVADAQDCAYAAHRHEITRADLMMALELRTDHANTHTLVELQKMTLVAHNLNRIPIPPIPQHCYSGVLLPPKPHQLTSRTFDIITGAQTAQKMNQPLPSPRNKKNTTKSSSNNNKNSASSKTTTKNTPSYGASRGRLIPISLQTKSTPTVPAPAAAAAAATASLTSASAPAAAAAPPSSNTPTTTATKVTPAQSSASGSAAPPTAAAATSGTK
jgi:histone H3/H4